MKKIISFFARILREHRKYKHTKKRLRHSPVCPKTSQRRLDRSLQKKLDNHMVPAE